MPHIPYRQLAAILLALLVLSGCESFVPPTESVDTMSAAVTIAPISFDIPAAAGVPSTSEVPSTTKAPTATEAPTTTEAPVTTEAPATTEVPATTEAPTTTEAPVPATIAPQALMYHLILDEPYSKYEYLFVTPASLAAHLETINAAGFRYLFADEYALQPDRTVILTLDDGYADNYTNLLPLLEKYDARATIFLITDMIGQPGYLTPEEILLLRDSGRVRFGLHTAAHNDLTTMDLPSLHADMANSVAAFTELVGYAPIAMAYPYGKYTAAVMEACREYVSFAYTTENPRYKPSFGTMNIPRHLVARDTSMWAFRRMLGLN